MSQINSQVAHKVRVTLTEYRTRPIVYLRYLADRVDLLNAGRPVLEDAISNLRLEYLLNFNLAGTSCLQTKSELRATTNTGA